MITAEHASSPQLALVPQTGSPRDPGATGTAADPGDDRFQLFGEDGFTFLDFLDIINPLQHIPVISTIYRHLTGDVIDPAPRVAGGVLFGGPIGAVVSLIDVIVDQSTGKDIGEHAMAMFEDQPPADGTGIAGNLWEDRYRSASTIPVDGPYPIPTTAEFALLRAEAEWAKAAAPYAAATGAEIALLRAEAGTIEAAAAAAPARSDALAPARSAALAPARSAAPARPAAASHAAPTGAEIAMLRVEAGSAKADAIAADSLAAAITADSLADAAIGDSVPDAAIGDSVPGATAPLGGWFSDVMLTALARYEQGARLTDVPPPAAVDTAY